MNSSKKEDLVRIQRDLDFFPHHILLGVAKDALDRARTNKAGLHHDELSAMTHSALALEALANSFGQRLIEDWKEDYESAGTIAKLRIVTGHLKVSAPDFSKLLWDDARWLVRFRNNVAHPKPELGKKYTNHMPRERVEKMRLELPQAKLQNEISLGNAERAFKTVEQIFKILCKHTPSEQQTGLLATEFTVQILGDKQVADSH